MPAIMWFWRSKQRSLPHLTTRPIQEAYVERSAHCLYSRRLVLFPGGSHRILYFRQQSRGQHPNILGETCMARHYSQHVCCCSYHWGLSVLFCFFPLYQFMQGKIHKSVDFDQILGFLCIICSCSQCQYLT